MALNLRQKRFVAEYLIDLNATQAAIRAGYSRKTAYSTGQRLLKNVEIQTAVAEARKDLEKRTNVTQERVIAELAKIGFTDITDYLSYKTALRVVDHTDTGEPVYDVAVLVEAIDSDEVDGAPIQEVSLTRDGTFKLKLHNKLDALDKLAKHLGLYAGEPVGEKDALAKAKELLEGVDSAI